MTAVKDFNATPLDSLVSDAKTIQFDPSTSIAEQLDAADQYFEATGVCLDFAAIETVSSAELSALIQFALQLRRREKSVAIRNVGPHLDEIFAITRFGAWTTE